MNVFGVVFCCLIDFGRRESLCQSFLRGHSMVIHTFTPRFPPSLEAVTIDSICNTSFNYNAISAFRILSLSTSVEQRNSYPVILQPLTVSLQTHFPLKYIHEPTKILALEAFSPSSMSIKTSDPSILLHHPPSFAQPLSKQSSSHLEYLFL